MTRKELLDKICPTDTRDNCYIGRDCDKCYEKLNAYLDEYDNDIMQDAFDKIIEFDNKCGGSRICASCKYHYGDHGTTCIEKYVDEFMTKRRKDRARKTDD